MAPVILVTFAGREHRMQILNSYVRKAMDDGLIDEWHIWDFTRSASDHDWVNREFGPVRYMGADANYQFRGNVSSYRALRMDARITNDLHIAIMPNNDPAHGYELIIGGWNNNHCAMRQIGPTDLTSFERGDRALIWSRPTPGILSPGRANDIVISISAEGTPELVVNGTSIGQWPAINLSAGASIHVRGGWGGDLELCETNAKIRRYVGNPNQQAPYWQSYQYYARRLNEFSDALFLKCDDDIVYMDLSTLSGFIEFRRTHPHYFVISANVVNNGVCAYWQQQAGSLPETLGHFERPPGGFGGTLWTDPSKANRLHDHFLNAPEKHLPLSARVIDWTERQSINFIAWLGADLKHLGLSKGDDEHMITVDLPTYLNRPTAIYSDFTVSHLSFGPQEKGMDVDRLIGRYDALMRQVIPV